MKRVLVTGGSGFIGRHLIELLCRLKYDVCNVDVSPPKDAGFHKYWVSCSILDSAALLREVVEFRPNCIVHLAARAEMGGRSLDDFRANTEGTRNVLNALQHTGGVERIVITSTQHVRAPGSAAPRGGRDYAPYMLYGESKVITEELTWKASLDCVWTIIRPTAVWGPGHRLLADGLWRQMIAGRYVHPASDPVIRSYGYVKNVVWQIERLLQAPAEAVNRKVFYVADGNDRQIDWVNAISVPLTGRKVRTVPVWSLRLLSLLGDGFKRVGLPFPLYRDRFKNLTTPNPVPIEPTLNLLGPPPYTVEEGARETVEWLRTYYTGGEHLGNSSSLHCLPSFDNKMGGSIHAALNVCRYLSEGGNPVEAVAPYSTTDDVAYLDAAYGSVKTHRVRRSIPKRFSNSRALATWVQTNAHRFAVVEIHGIWVLSTLRAARACIKAGIPYLVRPHGSLDPFDLQKHASLKGWLGPIYVRWLLNHSAGVICTATLEAERLVTYGANPERHVLPLPVPLPSVATASGQRFRDKHGIPANAKVVLFLSRIDYKKGLNFLIPALGVLKREFDDLWFVLAGSGPDDFVAKVKGWIEDHKVTHFTSYVGFVSGEEKQDAFAAADIFALPSLNENFGIVNVEAMHAGLPLLISDQVYIHREIADAGAGVICQPDVDSVTEKLRMMLNGTVDLRAMSEAGRILVQRRYRPEAATDALVTLYERIAANRETSSSLKKKPVPTSTMSSLFWLRASKLMFCVTHPECWPALARGVSPSIEHKDVLKTVDCDLLMDVGANRGQFSLMCRLLHPDVPIHAYEPQQMEASVYRKVLAGEHRISVHEIALGDGAGTAKLHVSGRADSSSLLPIGKLQTELYPSTAEVATREVDVFTLDSLREHWGASHRALLKLDVQGFELQVLRGAREALKRCAYVYAECSQVALYEGQALFSEVEAFLKDEGFIVSHRENEQWADGKLIQADYLFVRSVLKPERKESRVGSAAETKRTVSGV